MESIHELLTLAATSGASDLHVTVGAPPILRINGDLQMMDRPALAPADTVAMVRAVLTNEQWEMLQQEGELDISYSIAGLSRFRVNAFLQRGCFAMAMRLVPAKAPSFESLRLPEVVRSFADKSQGLVLVTGPTGSGKSTTLAALVDYMNHTQRRHIITLEDPIEYLHKHDLCVIDQREVGLDTKSFAKGLRAALRQDPDVLLVGELRDLETITTAITAAETGHLVLSTLHTPDAPQSIDRMIDVFSPGQQQQIRIQLAGVLVGIMSQRLLSRTNGASRVAAVEVMINTPGVANLIRSEKVHQIRSAMQTGRAYGMQTMEMSLRELFNSKLIHDSVYKQYVQEWAPTVM